MVLHVNDLSPGHHAALKAGGVIPAHPLALDENRRLDARRQRALSRYYIDAGVTGLAVGVHTTQFAIREAGLYEPVLRSAIAAAADWTDRPLAMIAGLVGRTEQARREADVAPRPRLPCRPAQPRRDEGCRRGRADRALRQNRKGTSAGRLLSSARRSAASFCRPASGDASPKSTMWSRSRSHLSTAIGRWMSSVGLSRRVRRTGLRLLTGNDDHIVADLLTSVPLPPGRSGR